MMNTEQIEAAKKAAAKTDMGRARRNGSIIIAETTEGAVELSYASGTYTLVRYATYKQTFKALAQGKLADVAKVLETLYVVVQ